MTQEEKRNAKFDFIKNNRQQVNSFVNNEADREDDLLFAKKIRSHFYYSKNTTLKKLKQILRNNLKKLSLIELINNL